MSLIKFFILLYKRSLSLLRSSTLLAVTLIVFQIVISVAFIVSYTTIFVNRNEDDKATMFRRPFEVSFKTLMKDKNIISKINRFRNRLLLQKCNARSGAKTRRIP